MLESCFTSVSRWLTPSGRCIMRQREFVLASMKQIFGAIALAVAVMGQSMAADDGATPTLAPILKKIAPAVVKIEIRGRAPAGPNARRREIHEVGSRVVYDASQGMIFTTHHAMDHAQQITVALTDGLVL